MQNRNWLTAILVLVGMVGPGGTAHAALITEWLSIAQLVEQADAVFLGNVIDTRSFWDGDLGEICTVATLRVQSEIKGRAGDDGLVRIRVPGGRVASVVERVKGAPAFVPDETVLIFVSRRHDGCYDVVGMSQGKYSVRQDGYSGIQFAMSNTSGLERLAQDGPNTYHSETASVREVLLQDLVAAIEQHIQPRLVMR